MLMTFLTFSNNFNVQLIIAELMFCLYLKPRIKIYQIILLIAAYCAFPYLLPNVYFWDGFRIGEWFTFGFIVVMLMSVGLIWVSFKFSSIKELLFYWIPAVIIQHLAYSFSQALALATLTDDQLGRHLIEFAVCLVVYTLYYFLIVRRLAKDSIPGVRSIYLIVFTCISAFIVYVLSMWTTMIEANTVGEHLFDTICCLLILFIHFGMFERSRLEKQNEIMERILHLEKEKHAMSIESIELINMKCHDLKYHISEVRNAESEQLQNKSLDELEKAINFYDMSIKTGNDTLDILLSERSLIWDRHKIHFSCVADGGILNFILPSDLYSMFGNALDNAIESVKKIADDDKRVISLNIASKGNYIIINITNYFEDVIVFNEELPLTTKPDNGYHGFGLKSIKYLAEKYGGTLSILTQNDIFILNLLIPVV